MIKIIIIIFSLLLLSPLARFVLTPIISKTNYYIYLNSIFLIKQKNNIVKIHLGSIYDLFKTFPLNKRNIKKDIFIYLLDGLLKICIKIENKEINTNTQIVITTFFINKKTATRFGFSTLYPNYLTYIFFYLKICDIIIFIFFTKDKISFPDIHKLLKFKILASELLLHKEVIEKSLNNLKIRNS